jgi:hypothetical protein
VTSAYPVFLSSGTRSSGLDGQPHHLGERGLGRRHAEQPVVRCRAVEVALVDHDAVDHDDQRGRHGELERLVEGHHATRADHAGVKVDEPARPGAGSRRRDLDVRAATLRFAQVVNAGHTPPVRTRRMAACNNPEAPSRKRLTVPGLRVNVAYPATKFADCNAALPGRTEGS